MIHSTTVKLDFNEQAQIRNVKNEVRRLYRSIEETEGANLSAQELARSLCGIIDSINELKTVNLPIVMPIFMKIDNLESYVRHAPR